MKKIFFVLVSLFFSVNLFAGELFNTSLSLESGLMEGKIQEYVFYIANKNDIRQLSKLDWDVYHIPYMDIGLGIDTTPGFSFNSSFRMGIPKASNVMQDYDWLNVYGHMEDNFITNYSIHQNFLDNYYKLSVSAGWDFKFDYSLYLKPDFFYERESFLFYAQNGFAYYGDNYPDSTKDKPHMEPYENKQKLNKKEYFKGKVILYSQIRDFLGMGLTVGYTYGKCDFSLRGALRYAVVKAQDHHLLRYQKFLDFPSGFGGGNITGNFLLRLAKHHFMGLTLDYDYLPVIKGTSYNTSEDSEIWSKDSVCMGGASSQIFSASLSYTLTF